MSETETAADRERVAADKRRQDEARVREVIDTVPDSLLAVAFAEMNRSPWGMTLFALLKAAVAAAPADVAELELPMARDRKSGALISMLDLAVQWNLVNPLTSKIRPEVIAYLKRGK